MEKFIDNAKDSLSCINENKYMIGITMIMLNIGARFIIDELDDDLRDMITKPSWVRKLIIFCAFFMATRDLFTSMVLTIVFIIIINEFFGKDNENNENDENNDKGNSFNKKEIEQTIQKLKTIQMNM